MTEVSQFLSWLSWVCSAKPRPRHVNAGRPGQVALLSRPATSIDSERLGAGEPFRHPQSNTSVFICLTRFSGIGAQPDRGVELHAHSAAVITTLHTVSTMAREPEIHAFASFNYKRMRMRSTWHEYYTTIMSRQRRAAVRPSIVPDVTSAPKLCLEATYASVETRYA